MKFDTKIFDKQTTKAIDSPASILVRQNKSISNIEERLQDNSGSRILRFDSPIAVTTPVLSSKRLEGNRLSIDQVDELGDFMSRLCLSDNEDENSGKSSSTKHKNKREKKVLSKEVQSLGRADPSKGVYSIEVMDSTNEYVTVRRSCRFRS